MPSVRTPYRTGRRARTSNTKARKSGTGKRSRKLTTHVVSYNRQAIESPSVGLGSSVFTKLRTIVNAPVVLSALGSWNGYMRPGSAYDPMGDTGITQPNMWDKWAAIYDRYLVTGFTVKLTLVSKAATAGANPATLVAWPSNYNSPAESYADAAGQPYAKKITYGGYGSPAVSMYFKVDMRKQLGLYGPLTSAANGAIVNTNPPAYQTVYLPMLVQSMTTTATSPDLVIQVELVQDVWFDQRKLINDVVE